MLDFFSVTIWGWSLFEVWHKNKNLRLVFEVWHKDNQVTAVELYTFTPIVSTHFRGHQRERGKKKKKQKCSFIVVNVSGAEHLLFCVLQEISDLYR